MLAGFLSIAPFFSTLLGGAAVLRLRHRLHPIMGFAAGVVVATALADLLPEANDQVGADRTLFVGAAAAAGYLAFSALEALLHRQSWEHQHPPLEDPHGPHEHEDTVHDIGSWLGILPPLGLIAHSVMDGLAIGLGFQAGNTVGVTIALAVIAHDFADGMNVVTLAFSSGKSKSTALVVLGLDALAPVIGAVIGSIAPLSHKGLGTLLAFFAGVFVAIGAGHLLPEAQHQQPGRAPAVVGMAALGVAFAVAVRAVAP
jgi:ZIP family zinc transporter